MARLPLPWNIIPVDPRAEEALDSGDEYVESYPTIIGGWIRRMRNLFQEDQENGSKEGSKK